jgi:hypothetical protein
MKPLHTQPWPFVLVLDVVLVIAPLCVFDYDYDDDQEELGPGLSKFPHGVFAPSLFILWNES